MTRLEQILAIDGMTETYAQALVQIGLDTYWEIYRLREDTLVSKVEQAVNQGLITSGIDTHLAVRWQKSAVRLSLTRFVDVRVESSRYKQPLGGAVVEAGDIQQTTDDQGYARLAGVRIDTKKITVNRQDFYELEFDVDLRPELAHSFRFSLVPSLTGARSPVFLSEYQGDFIEIYEHDSDRLRDRSIHEIPSGAVLQCIKKDDAAGTARLVSLLREKDGMVIYTDRVDLDATSLPPGLEEGSLLEWNNGSLSLAPYTREEFTRERAKIKFGFNSPPRWPKLVLDGVPETEISEHIALPEVEPQELTEQQKQELSKAIDDYPDGVPLQLLRSLLESFSN